MSEATVRAALERRRRAVGERWNLGGQIVLIAAGEPLPVPGRGDLTYRFRAHSEYFYLTDRERPGGVLAFDAAEGWVDFVRPVTRAEVLWEGGRLTEDGATVADPVTVALDELPAWLAQRSGRPVACLGAELAAVGGDPALSAELRRGLSHVRRRKDEVELSRMRAAERATRAGFATVAGMIEPGRSERELQIELEAAFLRAGADALAFDTIVGSGPNSAVLHVAPSHRRLAGGELVLIDAGGEYRGYASDVTRTYPVSGRFAPEQAELHALVARAAAAAIECSAPGTEVRELHLAAAHVIAEGLSELGILRGGAGELVERGAVSLFFPHGIGHLVGLGVRDASEIAPGRSPDPVVFPGLRVDLPLADGFAITVEPGIYFVSALLDDPAVRQRQREAVRWDRVEALRGFGGIRIEHNVLVTADGHEVLTADIPL